MSFIFNLFRGIISISSGAVERCPPSRAAAANVHICNNDSSSLTVKAKIINRKCSREVKSRIRYY